MWDKEGEKVGENEVVRDKKKEEKVTRKKKKEKRR